MTFPTFLSIKIEKVVKVIKVIKVIKVTKVIKVRAESSIGAEKQEGSVFHVWGFVFPKHFLWGVAQSASPCVFKSMSPHSKFIDEFRLRDRAPPHIWPPRVAPGAQRETPKL